MKRSKLFLLAFLFIINTIILSGCWNYKEIDNLAIVAGVAIDKGENGNDYKLTAEIIDIRPIGREASQIASKRIEAYGKTIFDAIRNAIKISAKKLFWSDAKVFVISQSVAKEGILPILDFIYRDSEPRLQLHILISKEKTANELLTQQSITTDIRSFEMEEMVLSDKYLSKSPQIEVDQITNALAGESASFTLPAVGVVINDGYRTSELSGMALFKKDKFIGFMDEDNTKYFLFIKNQIEGGLLLEKVSPEGSKPDVTFEVFKNKTRVRPVYSKGEISMSIDVSAEVTVDELDTLQDYTTEKGRNVLIKKAEQSLRTQLADVIKKVQRDYNTDIFGFGNIIYQEMPSLWKSIKPKWDKIFSDLDVNINTSINIRNSALAKNPIKVGDY
jgi:spore germination protein KC